jgi:hypothetical protein
MLTLIPAGAPLKLFIVYTTLYVPAVATFSVYTIELPALIYPIPSGPALTSRKSANVSTTCRIN